MSSTALSRHFWLADQIYYQMCDLDAKYPHFLQELSQRITPLFQRQFPKFNLTKDSIQYCFEERQKALNAIKDIPNLYHADGKLSLDKLIKEYLRRNPRLSLGAYQEHPYVDSSRFRKDRIYFAHEISYIMGLVNGEMICSDYVEEEIKTIQQHVIFNCWRTLPSISVAAKDVLDLMLSFFLDAMDSGIRQVEWEKWMALQIEKIQQELAALSDHPALHGEAAYRVVQNFSHMPSRLWPLLIDCVPFLQKILVQLRASGKQNSEAWIERLFALAQALPPTLTKKDFCEPISDDAVYYFIREVSYAGLENDEIYDFFLNVPRTQKEHLPLQIHFFIANEHTPLSDAPVLCDFIKTWIEKRFIERVHVSPEDLYREAVVLLEEMIVFTYHTGLNSKTNKQLLRRIHLCAKQGDLIWRTINGFSRSQRYCPFDPNSSFFTTMKTVFDKNLDPHPLFNREKILAEWEKQYLNQFPDLIESRKCIQFWGERYFKFLWYVAPSFSQSIPGRPTIHFFLEWQIAKILRETPDIPINDLPSLLQEIIAREIPLIPCDDFDIESVLRKMIPKMVS